MTAFICFIETDKQILQLLLGKRFTSICYCNAAQTVIRLHRQNNCTLFRCILDSILYEIHHHLLYTNIISIYDVVFVFTVPTHCKFFILYQQLIAIQHITQQLFHREKGELQLYHTAFQPRQLKQLCHHMVQSLIFVQNNVTIVKPFCILQILIANGFCICTNQCQRCFEIMGYIGDKFLPHPAGACFPFQILCQQLLIQLQLINIILQFIGHIINIFAQFL